MSRFRQLMTANQGSKYPANATVWVVSIPEGGADYSFRVASRSECVIDWGDNATESVPVSGSYLPTHRYTPAGVYVVSITGQHDWIHLASQSETYGVFVTGLIQVSNTLTTWSTLAYFCTGLKQLPSSLTIPQNITNVNGCLGGTNISAIPSGMLLHDGITDCNGFLSRSSIQYLPDGFTIPDSAAAYCSRTISRCSKLKRLPESFRIPQAATVIDQFFLDDSALEYIPKECRIPPNAVNISYFASSAFKAGAADIAELFAVWNPQSENINLRGAFDASNVGGIAPADKLWENPLSSTWNVTNCFVRAFNVENLGEIPATWGGGKIILDDTTITMPDSTVDFVLLKENVNIARFSGLYGVKVELTGLPDGLKGAWSGSDYKITGTLPAGTYTFTAHVYNKYDTTGATATITLIVKGNEVGGSDGGGNNVIVDGVAGTMAGSFPAAMAYADGTYTPYNEASGNERVWHRSSDGGDLYIRWASEENNWVITDLPPGSAIGGAPYIYATTAGSDPWTSSGWEFSLTGPVDISVTQA